MRPMHEILNRHKARVHRGERPFKCTYKDCKKAFGSKDVMEMHVRTVHDNARPFSCTEDGCKKSYKSQQHVNTGMLKMLTGTKIFLVSSVTRSLGGGTLCGHMSAYRMKGARSNVTSVTRPLQDWRIYTSTRARSTKLLIFYRLNHHVSIFLHWRALNPR